MTEDPTVAVEPSEPAFMPTDLVDRPTLRRILGVSSETLRRYLKAQRVPPPAIDVSRQRQQWRVADLREAGIRV